MAHSYRYRTNTDPDRFRDRRLAGRITVMETPGSIILIPPPRRQTKIRPGMIDGLCYGVVCVAVAYFSFMLIIAGLG
jgi:hypothetical protein